MDASRHRLCRNRGFTLLEILIALVVLAIGMLGLSRLTIANIGVNSANKNALTASILLQDHMESIKRAGYAGANDALRTEDYNTIHYRTLLPTSQLTCRRPQEVCSLHSTSNQAAAAQAGIN